MAKGPTATSAIAWWPDAPREHFSQRCAAQFDVRLSCKLGTGSGLPRQHAIAANKLAHFRSGQASASKAGIRRRGFGITERHS